jgi:hypothetical protein
VPHFPERAPFVLGRRGNRRIRRNTRQTDFGKTIEERELVLQDLAVVEPLLRADCTHELDARRPLEEVADALVPISLTS